MRTRKVWIRKSLSFGKAARPGAAAQLIGRNAAEGPWQSRVNRVTTGSSTGSGRRDIMRLFPGMAGASGPSSILRTPRHGCSHITKPVI